MSGSFKSGANVADVWKNYYQTGEIDVERARRDAPWLLGASYSKTAIIHGSNSTRRIAIENATMHSKSDTVCDAL